MKKDIINIVLIAAIWIIFILIVNPSGEFTREDDFAYARPVKTLLDTGEMHLTDWSSMTLVGHVWIGWVSTSLFGFSYTVLRLTELFFSFIGMIGVYYLSKEFFRERWKQLAAVLFFGISPQFFFYSFAFMTDITFFAFFVWAIFFFVRYLKYEHTYYFVIAVLLAGYALLIRDLALVLPLAFFFAGLSKYGIKPKKLTVILLPLVILVLEYFAYRYWLVNIHGLTKNMDFSRDRLIHMLSDPVFLFKTVTQNLIYSTMYLGLYLSPIAIPALFAFVRAKGNKIRTKYSVVTLMIFSLTAFVLVLLSGKVFSIVQFVLTMHHLTFWYVIPDIHNPALQMTPVYSRTFYAILTSISVAGGLAIWMNLLFRLYDYYKDKKLFVPDIAKGAKEFIVWTFLIYYALIMSQIFFPRYQIQTVGILAIILLLTPGIDRARNKITYSFAAVMILFIAYSSVSATHDMMEFGRTRSAAIKYLTDTLNVSPAKIDGGFEYNSRMFFDWDYKPVNKNRWWVQDDEYVVVWGKIKNYKLIKEYDYIRFIPPGKTGKVYVYRRIEK